MSDTKVGDFYGLLGMRVDKGSFDKVGQALSTVKKAVAAFVGFKAVKGIVGAFDDVIEMGGHINDASQKTGVAVETLQEFGFAAGLSSVGLESLEGALGKANKNLAELAATGKGPAVDAMRSLGIAIKDVKGKPIDEVLLKVADKFQKLPDGPKKVAAAMDLFGKSGAELIPFLNQGGDGIARLRQEARDLGVVIDKETIASMDDFGDDIDRVKAGWQGFKNQAVAALLPLIKDFMPSLISTMKDVVAWTKEHKEEIREFVATVGRGIKNAIQGIIVVVQWVARIFKAVGTAIGQGLAWIVLKAQAVGRAFADAFAFAKSVAIGLWEGMKTVGIAIVDTFVAVGQGIINAFKAAFDWVVNKAKEVGKTLRNLPVIKQLGDLGTAIGGALATDVNSGFQTTKESWEEDHPGQQFPVTEEEFKAGKMPGATAPTTNPTTAPATAPMPAAQPVATVTNVGGINVAVTASPGMDENALAAKVGEAIDERMSAVFRHATADEGVA